MHEYFLVHSVEILHKYCTVLQYRGMQFPIEQGRCVVVERNIATALSRSDEVQTCY